MGLDRPFIEKRDFPVKRRGYDPDAVAAHLATVAGEIEALRRSTSAPGTGSLAAGASQQVRVIVEAAERSAAELGREAERERDRMLEQACGEADEHLARVSRAAAAMLERADALEREFTTLLDSVRASAARLTHELRTLEQAADALRPSAEAALVEPEAVPQPRDDEGARLVALNMALNGTSREETERYMAAHFGALDIAALLDDVYVHAGQ